VQKPSVSVELKPVLERKTANLCPLNLLKSSSSHL
jgi:hypothetical protein